MIGLNRRRTMGNSKQSYTLIDYIVNSNKNSRIITNCAPLNDNNYRFVLDVYFVSRESSLRYGTIMNSSKGYAHTDRKWIIAFNDAPNKIYAVANSVTTRSAGVTVNGSYIGSRYTLTLSYQKFQVNNIQGNFNSVAQSGNYISDNNIQLNNTSADAPIIRYYAFDVYYNNNLIHQYKPCLTSNGVYTMVDVLNDYICEVDGLAWSGN